MGTPDYTTKAPQPRSSCSITWDSWDHVRKERLQSFLSQSQRWIYMSSFWSSSGLKLPSHMKRATSLEITDSGTRCIAQLSENGKTQRVLMLVFGCTFINVHKYLGFNKLVSLKINTLSKSSCSSLNMTFRAHTDGHLWITWSFTSSLICVYVSTWINT